MKILKEVEYGTTTTYFRTFHYADSPGAGFSFACDKNGKLLRTNPEAQKNLEACLTGVVHGETVVDEGIISRTHDYKTPAVGKCDCCTRKVVLDSFTNTCECGADYNASGQRLTPRSQWGEETGESLTDILMAESDDWG